MDKIISTTLSEQSDSKLLLTPVVKATSTNALAEPNQHAYLEDATTTPHRPTISPTSEIIFKGLLRHRTDACRPPATRKFAHPCSCPPHVGSHLYDPVSERCLATTVQRSRLLRECSRHLYCSPDTICDARKLRCNCRPGYHLYYDTNSTFGCVPYDDAYCNKGYFFSTRTKSCLKMFDINELQPSFGSALSATQYSFVSIVVLWILLLILIMTAKLKKLRAIHTVRQSSVSSQRRAHSISHHHTSHLLHPFMAAAGGHRQMYNRESERRSLALSLEEPNLNDPEAYYSTGVQDPLRSSNRSLNNQPPKFEDIYPERRRCTSSYEDLPSYEEALYMQKNNNSALNIDRSKEPKSEPQGETALEVHEAVDGKNPPSERTMV